MHIEDILGLSFPVLYLLMYIAERIWPARDYPKVKAWGLVGVGFMILLMTAGILTPMFLPVEWLAKHRLLDGTKLGVAGGAIVGFLLIELVGYWYHRACHNSSLMWRSLHQMHHGVQRLDIPGSVVFHPFELVAQNLIVIGVSVLVLGLEPLAAAIIGFVMGFAALFQHWNVRTPRWVGYILQRPEAHGHHHELNVHAYNYSDFPLWDIVFGTFKNPATFEGDVGFATKPAFGKMLVGIDLSRELTA